MIPSVKNQKVKDVAFMRARMYRISGEMKPLIRKKKKSGSGSQLPPSPLVVRTDPKREKKNILEKVLGRKDMEKKQRRIECTGANGCHAFSFDLKHGSPAFDMNKRLKGGV